jgi:hypothetical protein
MLFTILTFSFITAFAQIAGALHSKSIGPCAPSPTDDTSASPQITKVQLRGFGSGTYADGENLTTSSRDAAAAGFNTTYGAQVDTFTFNHETGRISDGGVFFLHAYFGIGDPSPVVMFNILETSSIFSPLKCHASKGQMLCSAQDSNGTTLNNFQMMDIYKDGNLELGLGSMSGPLPIGLKIV